MVFNRHVRCILAACVWFGRPRCCSSKGLVFSILLGYLLLAFLLLLDTLLCSLTLLTRSLLLLAKVLLLLFLLIQTPLSLETLLFAPFDVTLALLMLIFSLL